MRPANRMRAAAVDLDVLVTLAADVPAQLARLGRVRMVGIEPRAPVLQDPEAFRPGRRVAGGNDAAALAFFGGTIPSGYEFVLRDGEVADLVEAIEVARAALVALLVLLELAAAETSGSCPGR